MSGHIADVTFGNGALRSANGRASPAISGKSEDVSSPSAPVPRPVARQPAGRGRRSRSEGPGPTAACAAFLASSSVTASTMRVALLDVVDRQLVQLVLQQRLRELRGGVERQHLRALQVGLGLVELLLRRAFLGDAADFLSMASMVSPARSARVPVLPMNSAECSIQSSNSIDGIGQPALFADLAIEPRRQAAAAEDVVDDIGRP